MAAVSGIFLFLSFLRGAGADRGPGRSPSPNVFREAAAAVRELLPAGVRETLLHYWKIAINSTTAVVNLVAELCSDLLDAFGFEGGELDTDRETLRRALSWGLAALLIYLMLSAVLHLLAYLAGRLLWLVKLGLFFLAAGYVVATCDDEKRRNTLLLGLGALYLLLGRLPLPFMGSRCTPSQHQHHLESKVAALEHQLAEMERKVHQRKLYDYDYE
ncbi:transmembrane protein 109-like [Stegostoma tigrinum]|uniref:transmembrane protein 109-like n=1 Tax=Stegostoma tigrinum TaxID=3053191 RepID=UPI00286FF0D7|nr:transmembrane protein 109-like [Stegostoma tigrinum]